MDQNLIDDNNVEDLFVSPLSVKLPIFWQSDPALWFLQIESIFRKHRITKQTTMFDYVVAELQPETMHEVRDIIANPDAVTPYAVLKRELLNRVSMSEHKRLQQLLNDVQLGDRRPSQLLRHMRSLLGDKPTDACLLKQLFLQRLPSPVQVALSLVPDQSLDTLASSADKVIEAMPTNSATGFTHLASTNTDATQFMSLIHEQQRIIQQIQLQLNQLTAHLSQSHSQPTAHHRSRSRSLNQSPSKTHTTDGICFYHRKFGFSARRCTTPCAFSTTSKPLKKQQHQLSSATNPASFQTSSRLFFISDKESGHKFLIDTGAEVSVLPATSQDQISSFRGPTLKDANGSSIQTYGQRSVTMSLGLKRTWRWIFLIADVRFAILGADFLNNFGLLVDMKHRRLLDPTTNLTVTGQSANVDSLRLPVTLTEAHPEYACLLAQFPGILNPNSQQSSVKRKTVKHISTGGPPVAARPRRLAPDKLAVNVATIKDIPQPNSSAQTRYSTFSRELLASYPDKLTDCSHVFVRCDKPHESLQPAYKGPHRVLNHSDKHYTLDIGDSRNNISIDRLIPARLMEESTPTDSNTLPETSTYKTKSGRSVRFPDRLVVAVSP